MKRFYQIDFYLQLLLFLHILVAFAWPQLLQKSVYAGLFYGSLYNLVLFILPLVSYEIRRRQPYPKDQIFRFSGAIMILQLTAPLWIFIGILFLFASAAITISLGIIMLVLWFTGRALYVWHTYKTYRLYGCTPQQVDDKPEEETTHSSND